MQHGLQTAAARLFGPIFLLCPLIASPHRPRYNAVTISMQNMGATMTYEFIRFEIDEGVAALTLNRPDKLNSFNRAMALETQEALKIATSDQSIRALLLTGEGRGFCAGQDLAEVLPKEGEPKPVLGDTVRDTYNPIIIALRTLEKPVVCAVNGVAAGAGANIAFACDLVLASEKASFVQSFSAIGLIPDSGGTFMLPRLIGLPRATALMMLGEKIKGEQAMDMGLIYKACAHEELMGEAVKLARHLAGMPTVGLGLTKRLLNAAWTNELEQQLDLERQCQTLAGETEDYSEGVAAFLEKRAPKYKGC